MHTFMANIEMRNISEFTSNVPLVGVIFDSGGDFGLSLYDDTESISFYKKVALKNNVYKSYLELK